MMVQKLILEGRGNYGPKQDYADKIADMTEALFLQEAEQKIWLSAYAGNNHRSDYHWMADACYSEAERRGKPDLYKTAYDRAVSSCQ
jgi:hypothetical protein